LLFIFQKALLVANACIVYLIDDSAHQANGAPLGFLNKKFCMQSEFGIRGGTPIEVSSGKAHTRGRAPPDVRPLTDSYR
jgi:hypothetical protein